MEEISKTFYGFMTIYRRSYRNSNRYLLKCLPLQEGTHCPSSMITAAYFTTMSFIFASFMISAANAAI